MLGARIIFHKYHYFRYLSKEHNCHKKRQFIHKYRDRVFFIKIKRSIISLYNFYQDENHLIIKSFIIVVYANTTKKPKYNTVSTVASRKSEKFAKKSLKNFALDALSVFLCVFGTF
jgi:hypothetical protein